MSNPTETSIPLRRPRETASEKEGKNRAWSSHIKALLGRLKGSPKAREELKSPAVRGLEQMVALYAPAKQPNAENRKLPALYRSEEIPLSPQNAG